MNLKIIHKLHFMKIKSFSIQNYRSLKSLEVPVFGDFTTIFYGDNNAGKSNVINALHLIFKRKHKFFEGNITPVENFYQGVLIDTRNSYFENLTSEKITFSVVIEIAVSALKVSDLLQKLFKGKQKVEFTFSGTISYVESSENDMSDFAIQKISIDKDEIFVNTEELHFFPTLDKTKKNQSEFETAFTTIIDVFNDCVYVINSDRDMHETKMKDLEEVPLSSKDFKNFLYNLYLSPTKFKQFEDINSVFSGPPFSFGSISFSKEFGNLEIMIKENEFRLPIKHLGSGILQCLYIVTGIICSKSNIICLEEPEQNLSPSKQYELLKKIQGMLADEQSLLHQLIISSHSSVYSKPSLGTIYYLDKVKGKTEITKVSTKAAKKKLLSHLILSFEPQTEYTKEEAEASYKEAMDLSRSLHDLR